MNGIIYCRVSFPEQVKGTSLESQEMACVEYARSKNIKVLKVFIERGESAKFADRTKLLELIDFCRQNKGKVQVLLVWKIDRFARNVGDHFSIKATLMKYGVRILSVTEPIDSNPEGKLMETILAGFAQFDNDIRAMRTGARNAKKDSRGDLPLEVALGIQEFHNQRGKENRARST
jgi:site-specific DNA recombinase